MNGEIPAKKKPRIRKLAPTIRERVEIEAAKAEKPKRRPVRKAASYAVVPFKAVARRRPKVPQNRFFSFLAKIFRPIGRVLNKLLPRYFINAWREVRKVTWPSRRETWRLTFAVFVFAAIFGGVAYVVDKALDDIFKQFVLK